MTTLNRTYYFPNEEEMKEGVLPFTLKDKWSAITHFIGFVFALIGMPILLIEASKNGCSYTSMISLAVFMFSMILLYGASTSYHSFNVNPRVNMILKKMDHMSIFILIAGSYTPICVIALPGTKGLFLLGFIWFVAICGMIFKLFWVTCPKWVSSVIYTAMGWACIIALPDLLSNLGSGFYWLLAGGILYTVGAIFYALKPSFFSNPEFGNHEIFHCFVLAGSLCHFLCMFQVLTVLG